MGRVKVNAHLLPIKSHFFFFMAAMGPILPQMSVYGKEMGISSVVMGSVTAVLPLAFLIAKPLFGLIVDIYRDYRKSIFMFLIIAMSTSFALLILVPQQSPKQIAIKDLRLCNSSEEFTCENSLEFKCKCEADEFIAYETKQEVCTFNANNTCEQVNCSEDIENGCLYGKWTFWYFIILMSIGMIGFNVVNSISDAICFDVIGEEYDYGKQRVWGTVGFGLTALLSGYVMDWISDGPNSYAPAFIIMLIFTAFDLFSCIKLKLPVMESPENIFKDIGMLMKNKHTIVFINYAVLAGVLDAFMVYFLFWYLEDLASETGTSNVKLIEGLVVAAETLGGEVLFFSISGKILQRIGHAHCFSMCFINYALRLGLISVVPSPWWILPIEFVFQGPTYALTYTTIVAYANAIAPPGASATMQGIAAGMDDGFGYAIGSLLGGYLYKQVGGRGALQILSCIGLICSVTHLGFSKFCLSPKENPKNKQYNSPNGTQEETSCVDDSTRDITCI